MVIGYIQLDRDNKYVISYSTRCFFADSVEVIHEEPTIYLDKLQGYKLVHGTTRTLVYDEEQYQAYLKEVAKEEAIKQGEEKLEELAKDYSIDNASDEDAYIMRYLFDEWNPDGYDYKKGDRFMWQDKFWKVILDHKSQADWTPDTASSLYVEIPDPSIEYPEFKQPTGAHDAYNKGDKVTFEGKKYICQRDGCVYSPTDNPSDWKEVTE